jgi:hypothetical protein
MRAVAKADGVTDAQFDAIMAGATAQRKLMEPNESAEELKSAVANYMTNMYAKKLLPLMRKGETDDLDPIELQQLGENYSRSVTPYAAVNFKELVAEKASAARFGYQLGVNNPPWRKFNSWMYPSTASSIDTTGMSRQQRRAAERAAAKKKDAKGSGYSAKDFEPVFELRVNSCTGFPHHYGKTKGKEPYHFGKIKGKEFSLRLNMKALDSR